MPIGPALVHILTALGVVCALGATLAVANGNFELMFIWLGAAFFIDGIDGPLARFVEVKRRLPRFSGETLDLVIDYLTYVFVPVLAILKADLLPAPISLILCTAILLSSLYHFAETASKADDNSFVGFPAIWNVVVFYLFVMQAGPWLAGVICLVCVLLTFVPAKWVHPMRVQSWRPVTLSALLIWFAAAGAAVWSGLDAAPVWTQAVLVVVAVYALTLPVLTRARQRM